jgi:hypothetical protein
MVAVPTFRIGGRLVAGFHTAETTGVEIERAIDAEAAAGPRAGTGGSLDVPWLGRLDTWRFGLPVLVLAVGLILMVTFAVLTTRRHKPLAS